MRAAPHLPDLSTAEAFVRWAAAQERKYEMMAGRLVMMAGGSNAHVTIAGNVLTALRGRLRGRPCRPYNSDFLVELDVTNRYYPDVTVACDETRDWTDRPVMVVEVLSPTTQRFDLTIKLDAYQGAPGLLYVLFLWQDQPHARLHHPGEPPHDLVGQDALILLPLLGLSLPLAELYEDVPLG
jgi:Uma2 family endonuclease